MELPSIVKMSLMNEWRSLLLRPLSSSEKVQVMALSDILGLPVIIERWYLNDHPGQWKLMDTKSSLASLPSLLPLDDLLDDSVTPL